MYQIIRDLDFQARNIQWLEFELSNNCQYSNAHKWCPASLDERGLIFLRSTIVKKVVDFFSLYDFSGMIYLSGYSEPLIDPRFLYLVDYIRRKLPKSNINMYTNCIALDENILLDVLDVGVNIVRLSLYSLKEEFRVLSILRKSGLYGDPRISIHKRYDKQVTNVGSGEDIDVRLNVYDEPGSALSEPCYIPSMYYFVRNNGDVNMCFWDWKYTQVFGNLYENSVEDTIMNQNRLNINHSLVNNNRNGIPVCSGCKLPAGRCIMEYGNRLKLE